MRSLLERAGAAIIIRGMERAVKPLYTRSGTPSKSEYRESERDGRAQAVRSHCPSTLYILPVLVTLEARIASPAIEKPAARRPREPGMGAPIAAATLLRSGRGLVLQLQ